MKTLGALGFLMLCIAFVSALASVGSGEARWINALPVLLASTFFIGIPLWFWAKK